MSRKKRRQAAITAAATSNRSIILQYCISIGNIKANRDLIEEFQERGAILKLAPHPSPFGASALVDFSDWTEAGKFMSRMRLGWS